jgi:hypothetical protein
MSELGAVTVMHIEVEDRDPKPPLATEQRYERNIVEKAKPLGAVRLGVVPRWTHQSEARVELLVQYLLGNGQACPGGQSRSERGLAADIRIGVYEVPRGSERLHVVEVRLGMQPQELVFAGFARGDSLETVPKWLSFERLDTGLQTLGSLRVSKRAPMARNSLVITEPNTNRHGFSVDSLYVRRRRTVYPRALIETMRDRTLTYARYALPLLIAAASATFALWFSPAEINGDGIGYLKRLLDDSLAPGHPAYPVLARLLVAQPQCALDGLWPLRLFSALSGAIALLFSYAAWRCIASRTQAIAVLSLAAASYAVLRSMGQVEVYAPALALSSALFYLLIRVGAKDSRSWPWFAACMLVALATMFHLTLALTIVPLGVTAWRRRGIKRATATVLLAGALIATGLCWAAAAADKTSLPDAWQLFSSADHGIPYQLAWYTPLVAIWGLGRTFAAAPYLHQAAPTTAIALSTLSLAVLFALVFAACRYGRENRAWRGHRPTLLAWMTPLALFGLFFFPSDTERWLFILPALGVLLLPIPQKILYGLAALLLIVNATWLLPRSLDDSSAKKARQSERLLAESDLLLQPGHGWAELVGLGMPKPPKRWVAVHQLGTKTARRSLEKQLAALICSTYQRGGRVFAARVFAQRDQRGFKELAWQGLARADYPPLITAKGRHRLLPTGIDQLWLLLPSCD